MDILFVLNTYKIAHNSKGLKKGRGSPTDETVELN